jgi:hypothetical protein
MQQAATARNYLAAMARLPGLAAPARPMYPFSQPLRLNYDKLFVYQRLAPDGNEPPSKSVRCGE